VKKGDHIEGYEKIVFEVHYKYEYNIKREELAYYYKSQQWSMILMLCFEA